MFLDIRNLKKTKQSTVFFSLGQFGLRNSIWIVLQTQMAVAPVEAARATPL
jgi:hypothetical protein